MSPASETDRLLANAERYAEEFDSGALSAQPSTGVAVLTCMDARIDVHALLGLEEGDAHVLRNAGGVVTDDAIRSLSISQHFLGTKEIVLIHHTSCGLLGFTDDEFAAELEAGSGERPAWRAHSFTDLEEDLRAGVDLLRASPFLPETSAISAFVYEVETGRLREVSLAQDSNSGSST
jgi:carbonic anhydrase